MLQIKTSVKWRRLIELRRYHDCHVEKICPDNKENCKDCGELKHTYILITIGKDLAKDALEVGKN